MKKMLIAIVSSEKENKIIFADCKENTIKAKEKFVVNFDNRKTLRAFLFFMGKTGRDIKRCELLNGLPFYTEKIYPENTALKKSIPKIEYKVYN